MTVQEGVNATRREDVGDRGGTTFNKRLNALAEVAALKGHNAGDKILNDFIRADASRKDWKVKVAKKTTMAVATLAVSATSVGFC